MLQQEDVVSFVRRRPVLTLLALTALVSLPFVLFPQLDLTVSHLFYVKGQGFTGSNMAALKAIREFGQDALRLAGLAIVVSLLVPLLVDRLSFLIPPRAALFLFTSLVLGPGLLVNGIFKEFWGRARPRNVVEFGGDLTFSGPWELVNYCHSNCSFVSGEASSAIWFMAFAMIAPAAWRLRSALVALVFAAVMSMNRIVFGGHFLSDVLLAWLLTLAVIVICYNVFYKNPEMTDERVEAWFTRARDCLHAALRHLPLSRSRERTTRSREASSEVRGESENGQ
jgi:membrane-associated PAP2 superfamily phosphatase